VEDDKQQGDEGRILKEEEKKRAPKKHPTAVQKTTRREKRPMSGAKEGEQTRSFVSSTDVDQKK